MKFKTILVGYLVLIIASVSAVVSALRLVGPSADFDEYSLLMIYQIGSIEPFWDFLRKYVEFTTNNLSLLYGVIAFIALSLKIPVFINTKLAIVVIPIYLSSFFFLHEYTQIRIALGLGIAYYILYNPMKDSWPLSLLKYSIPSLFHYSLAPLVLLTFFRRPVIILPALVAIASIMAERSYLEIPLEFIELKAGDNSAFQILNFLSAYLLSVHVLFIIYLKLLLPKQYLEFHNAAVIFALVSIPFGFLQFGTAYFRFQEISASLMLPVIFAAIAQMRGNKVVFWYCFTIGYYLILIIKIWRDLI